MFNNFIYAKSQVSIVSCFIRELEIFFSFRSVPSHFVIVKKIDKSIFRPVQCPDHIITIRQIPEIFFLISYKHFENWLFEWAALSVTYGYWCVFRLCVLFIKFTFCEEKRLVINLWSSRNDLYFCLLLLSTICWCWIHCNHFNPRCANVWSWSIQLCFYLWSEMKTETSN